MALTWSAIMASRRLRVLLPILSIAHRREHRTELPSGGCYRRTHLSGLSPSWVGHRQHDGPTIAWHLAGVPRYESFRAQLVHDVGHARASHAQRPAQIDRSGHGRRNAPPAHPISVVPPGGSPIADASH
jgi:hypothetical protein